MELALQMCLSSTEQRGRIASPDLLVTLLLMKDKGGNAKGPYLHTQNKTDVHIIVQNSSKFFLHISVHVSSKHLTKDCTQQPKLHKARASFVF